MAAHGNASDIQPNLDITLGRLQQLDQNERILVGLYFYESLSVDEIGMVLRQNREEVQHRLDEIVSKVSGMEVGRDAAISSRTAENIHG